MTPTATGALIVTFGVAAYRDVGASSPYDFVLPPSAGYADSQPNKQKNGTQAVSVIVAVKADWLSGAFNADALTLGTSAAQDSWAAVSLAIRPA